MPPIDSIAEHYTHLTDAQLLIINREGGLTDDAAHALAAELTKRNLKGSDFAKHTKSPRIQLRDRAQEKHLGLSAGTGLIFFGRSYLNEADKEANIQLRTKWFALGGIPLVPLESYRFKCTGNSKRWLQWNTEQRVLERVPLNWNQAFVTWTRTILILAATAMAVFIYFWREHK